MIYSEYTPFLKFINSQNHIFKIYKKHSIMLSNKKKLSSTIYLLYLKNSYYYQKMEYKHM